MNVTTILRALTLSSATKPRNKARQYAIAFENAADLECLHRLIDFQAISVMLGKKPAVGFNLTEMLWLSEQIPQEPGHLVATIDPIKDLARYIRHQLRLQRCSTQPIHPAIDAHEMADSLENLLVACSEYMQITFKLGN